MAALSFAEKCKLLPPASAEQRRILDLANFNVLVDSVAGSGKTTCVLYLALVMGVHYPREKLLLLTYNKKLRQETIQRCDRMQITNLEVHTYHSFANMYYRNGCGTDIIMNEILASDSKPIHDFAYNRIIIDESQDMTGLYFQLVSRIILHNKIKPIMEERIIHIDGQQRRVQIPTEPKMLVIGDKHQSIFTFNNADYRFITLAPEVFKFNGLQWKAAKLTTSYRITIPMAAFLNRAVLHQDRLAAVKQSHIKPRYIITNPYAGGPFMIINNAIKKYGIENIFVIAPSVRSAGSPIIKTANKLSKKGHPIYIGGQEEVIDQSASAGKLVFATYHQVKGLERKCVIVMGVDASYFEYHEKYAPRNICPNVFYVALTRASEELVMIHAEKTNFLPFLDVEQLRLTCTVEGELSKVMEQPKIGKKNYAVTDLLRHLSSSTMIATSIYINEIIINPIIACIRLPDRIPGISAGQVETVSEINGVVIPAYFQYYTTGKLSILDMVRQHDPRYKMELSSSNSDACIEEITQIAVRYGCIVSKYIYKEKQLPHFHWLSRAIVQQCIGIMGRYISTNSEYEICLPSKIVNGIVISGVADLIDHNQTNGKSTLWELKCTNEIKREHILQLCCYAYLCGDIYNYKILNIVTGEVRQIFWSPDLVDLVELIVNAKISDPNSPSDEQFIAFASEIRQNTKLRLPTQAQHDSSASASAPVDDDSIF